MGRFQVLSTPVLSNRNSMKPETLFFYRLASDGSFPPTVVYDDGCHLTKYLHNHFDIDLASTPASIPLKQTPFSIDRAHFKNHVGRWCREEMDPDKNRCINVLVSIWFVESSYFLSAGWNQYWSCRATLLVAQRLLVYIELCRVET